MSDSSHVRDVLPAIANGSADEAERAAVDAHIASCAACAADLQDWRQIAVALRGEDVVAVPDTAAVLQGVWDRLDGDEGRTASSRRGRSSWSELWRPVWSTAAVFVLILGLVVVERVHQTPREVLLAAAVRTTELDTARLRVTGSARFALGRSDASSAGGSGAFDAEIRGRGAVRFGEALHVRLRVDLDAGAFGVEGRSSTMERLVLDGERHERRDNGEWVALDDRTGLVGVALLDPRLPEVVLTKTKGPIHVDSGTERVNGVDLRRYAFELAPDALPQPPGATVRYRAEAWLSDSDGLLHALRIRATGPTSVPVAGMWDVDLRIDLADVGEPVAIPSPVATQGGDR